MPVTQRDVRNRIDAVKNIQKITRAMEMVAAARLRRAEQRIEALRPYASAIRRMTRQAAEAAGNVPNLPILAERENVSSVGLLLIAGDRGLAGAFNSNIVRRGVAAGREHDSQGRKPVYFASGRRPASSLTFRGLQPADSFTGFTDRPAYADARRIAERLIAAYVDEEVDRVELIYNRFVSPLTQYVWRQTLLPLQQAEVVGEGAEEEEEASVEEEQSGSTDSGVDQSRSEWFFEPDAEELLGRLIPEYVTISVYRALLESAASELGARMTAMRNAAENAEKINEKLTLEMNRARQAEITQEILEVVAGAEALS